MQTDATGSHSLVPNENSLRSALFSLSYSDSVDRQGENHTMATNNFTIANSDEFWNAQPERNAIRDFSAGNINYSDDRFMINEVPFSGSSINPHSAARFCTVENQTKLTTLDSFGYPFQYPKNGSSTTAVNSSFETMNQGCYNASLAAFDTNTQWDFNNFTTTTPPELIGRITAGKIRTYNPNEWMMTEQVGLNSNSPGSSRFSNELSLSLSSSQRSAVNGTSIQEQCSEMSSSGYSLQKRRSEHASCSSSNLSLSFNSQKPIQLRFLHAMQEILAEIACYALGNFDQTSYNYSANGVNLSYSPSDGLDRDKRIAFQNNLTQEREVEAKKKHLLDLLQMVDEQYNQCLDEIHTVISAFHAVTEMDPNVHARFALPTISLMYKNLRERISSHILAMGEVNVMGDHDERDDDEKSSNFIQKQWALQQLRKRDHQFMWRPQRGLPERSVSVLRSWMFQNFLHPYPKDAEKHLLAVKSGLTRSQVSNWFINARVRLWKPMIEEMYSEMNRRKVRGKDEETHDGIGSQRNLVHFENRRFTMD